MTEVITLTGLGQYDRNPFSYAAPASITETEITGKVFTFTSQDEVKAFVNSYPYLTVFRREYP